MMYLLLGIAIGFVIGYNLPQPEITKAILAFVFDRVERILKIIFKASILLCLILPGCSSVNPFTPRDIGYAKERAMAEIAIASVANGTEPTPVNGPKVGEKCPDCNDPPGACGVGKVGDGRICVECRTCRGDGRIDEGDVTGESVIEKEVPKEVTLRVTSSTLKGWPSQWYSDNRQKFVDEGWIVRLLLEPDSASKVAYFDVVAPDGEVFQFYSPITLEDVYHLETRR